MAQTTTSDPFSPKPGGFDPSTYYEQRDKEAAERELAARPPKKRLVVCCDGTWQSSNHGIQSIPSNIAKISRALAKYTREADGTVVHQVVFYDAGVGTATDSVKSKAAGLTKSHQGAYGEGLDENVCEAYNFLVNNYNRGDEVYFFEFSRGAYTARAAAGLVARVGLCSNAMMDDFYLMYKAYKLKKPEDPLSGTSWGVSPAGSQWLIGCEKNITIKVVGVFDTVGALGWPNNTHIDVTEANAPFAFHNTEVHPEIENAFQALALDEHRAAFPPTLWSLPKVEAGQKQTAPKTNLIQCWFPGYHINCGGGSDDMLKDRKGDFESMANMTFAWMVDRVQQYTSLAFDEDHIFRIIDRYAKNISAVIEKETPLDGKNHKQVYRGWGLGPDVDSMTWKMQIAGSEIRHPAQYHQAESRITNEYIHPVVGFALDKSAGNKWKPESLEGFKRTPAPKTKENPEGKGHVWQKTYTPASEQGLPVAPGKPITLTIPEWVIPAEPIGENGMYQCPWGYNIERQLIRADTSRYYYHDKHGNEERKRVVENTIAFIKKMDRDNGLEESPLRMYDPAVFANVNIPSGWSLVSEKKGEERTEIGKTPNWKNESPFVQGGFMEE